MRIPKATLTPKATWSSVLYISKSLIARRMNSVDPIGTRAALVRFHLCFSTTGMVYSQRKWRGFVIRVINSHFITCDFLLLLISSSYAS